jgi:hypothetical protein
MMSIWYDLVDDIKALLTALGFHLLQLFLVILFNVLWFWGLFLLLRWWLVG